jgi:hypothetical protein
MESWVAGRPPVVAAAARWRWRGGGPSPLPARTPPRCDGQSRWCQTVGRPLGGCSRGPCRPAAGPLSPLSATFPPSCRRSRPSDSNRSLESARAALSAVASVTADTPQAPTGLSRGGGIRWEPAGDCKNLGLISKTFFANFICRFARVPPETKKEKGNKNLHLFFISNFSIDGHQISPADLP